MLKKTKILTQLKKKKMEVGSEGNVLSRNYLKIYIDFSEVYQENHSFIT